MVNKLKNRLLGGIALLASAFVLPPMTLSAETVVSTELTLMANAERTESGDTGFYNLSNGKFSLSSKGLNEVKGQLTVDVEVTDTVLIDIQKAWLKAQLAAFRLTMGKTRLSWGEGYMYNAGDVIFGGKGADLSAEELRDNNAWLASLYLPIGDFSFIEAVALPPDLPILAWQQYAQAKASADENPVLQAEFKKKSAPEIAGPKQTSAGGRAYTKLGGLKFETGYLWDGTDELHKPYVSLQGHLLADLHASSSIELGSDKPFSPDTKKSWRISGGALYQLPLSSYGENPSSGTLDFRFEAMVSPYGEWNAETLYAAPFNPLSGDGNASPYALSLFPQISWKSDTLFAYVRSVISPIDASAISSIGLHWAPLQGFKILSGFSLQSGNDGDVYVFDGAQGWKLSLGTRVDF